MDIHVPKVQGCNASGSITITIPSLVLLVSPSCLLLYCQRALVVPVPGWSLLQWPVFHSPLQLHQITNDDNK